jgi:serine/threonine protein kinase
LFLFFYLIDIPHDANNESIDSLLLHISTLRAATGNFTDSNKLGEGGFGAVYKVTLYIYICISFHFIIIYSFLELTSESFTLVQGVLRDGQEIAVKRLSHSSEQGVQELKNELVLVAKLQHKNLVRLVGVCLEEHEKLIVYEYMPNRSIDAILFG